MDIVIPYKKNNTGELEACIKLIRRNVPHRGVYVIDNYARTRNNTVSHINQILKLRWALQNIRLTEEFYLFNDDFFVMKPIEEVPYYHRGFLSDHILSRKPGGYTRALTDTLNLLGKDALSYEVHLPMKFHREKLRDAIEDLSLAISSNTCPLIRSYYGNKYNVGGEEVEDVKNPDNYEGMTFLSTSDYTFRRELGDYIRGQV